MNMWGPSPAEVVWAPARPTFVSGPAPSEARSTSPGRNSGVARIDVLRAVRDESDDGASNGREPARAWAAPTSAQIAMATAIPAVVLNRTCIPSPFVTRRRAYDF